MSYNSRVFLDSENTLVMLRTVKEDVGQYRCEVRNDDSYVISKSGQLEFASKMKFFFLANLK